MLIKKNKKNKNNSCISRNYVLLYSGSLKRQCAPVAQPDRVTGYEPVGRGFESLPARYFTYSTQDKKIL